MSSNAATTPTMSNNVQSFRRRRVQGLAATTATEMFLSALLDAVQDSVEAQDLTNRRLAELVEELAALRTDVAAFSATVPPPGPSSSPLSDAPEHTPEPPDGLPGADVRRRDASQSETATFEEPPQTPKVPRRRPPRPRPG